MLKNRDLFRDGQVPLSRGLRETKTCGLISYHNINFTSRPKAIVKIASGIPEECRQRISGKSHRKKHSQLEGSHWYSKCPGKVVLRRTRERIGVSCYVFM